MTMRLSYKQKLFTYFLIVFSIFTIIIVLVQQNREKMYKTENLKTSLSAYTGVVEHFIKTNRLLTTGNLDSLKYVLPLLPDNLRLTIISDDGKVLFDNGLEKDKEIENHAYRPEISSARVNGSGTNTRQSKSLGMEFYYYAHSYDDCIVRVALPYNVSVQDFLKADNIFIYFIILLFFTTLISLIYISDRFGKAITGLKDFILSAEQHEVKNSNIKFPDTELGEIGNKIVSLFRQLDENKNQLNLEKEKLIRHFHHSDEGICIFSAKNEKIYANSYFIQYLNTILDEPTFDIQSIFSIPEFKPLKTFLAQNAPVNPQANAIPIFSGKISKNGKHFAVKLLIFHDNSYEITLNNISAAEKNRILKQEMTNNIAHELKTPVSSIRGYIETLLEQDKIEPGKQKFFLERTYTQVLRLSDLIRDVALITKTEEASELFEKEKINIAATINEVTADLQNQLQQQHITVNNHVKEEVEIEGNHTLLFSIFRNLIDNVINYAGENITIGIDNYAEDAEFYYFSFYDTGTGVEEEHLERIFDRFYRISEGRSRKTGGSGLGLSIVKNAILFHKGQISAKNRKDGGLEFIFSLRKSIF